MKKRELEKILKQNGWNLQRQGKHEICEKNGRTIPLPRHKGDIPAGTANSILKRAGIK